MTTLSGVSAQLSMSLNRSVHHYQVLNHSFKYLLRIYNVPSCCRVPGYKGEQNKINSLFCGIDSLEAGEKNEGKCMMGIVITFFSLEKRRTKKGTSEYNDGDCSFFSFLTVVSMFYFCPSTN
jgi:hypothetical protein